MTIVSIPPSTRPSSFTMLTSETLPLGFDTSALLAEGETPSAPVCVLTDITAGETIDLADDPTIDGNVITQIVRGPTDLEARHQFALAVTFTAAEDTIWTMLLALVVPS